MDQVIGIDFDNTLVDYSHLVHELAVERGLVEPTVARNKRDVRNRIRQRPNGEQQWQRLQAALYGTHMHEARLSDGVVAFTQRCRRHGVRPVIVSHKTEVSPMDSGGVNLRRAALDWMAAHGVFHPEGLGLAADDVFFEATRAEKIARIRELRCTHFIDDLEETFLEPTFPQAVEQLLYAPGGSSGVKRTTRVFSTWQAIGDYLFNSTR